MLRKKADVSIRRIRVRSTSNLRKRSQTADIHLKEMVLLRFRCEGAPKKRLERQSFPERGTKVRLLRPEETGAKTAIRRQPHPVAAAAVGMRHGRDDADRASRPVKTEVARRPVPSRRTRSWLDRRDAPEAMKNLIAGNNVIPGELAHFSNGHQLDEPNVPLVREGETSKVA